MNAGIIADIVIGVIIILNLIVCTRCGLVRCVLHCFSTVAALVVAMLTAGPLAKLCDKQFGWGDAVAKWHVPFISASTLLKLMVGVAVFIVVRLILGLLGKLVKGLKEKLPAVNVVDRIFGTLFGVVAALVELTFVFMIINQFGWQSGLALTEKAGGYFAWRLFEFCEKYMFNIVTSVFAAAADSLPQI